MFGRLVEQVTASEPYASARRVFWVVDNGSSHRGQASVDRLEGAWPNLTSVHRPVHASPPGAAGRAAGGLGGVHRPRRRFGMYPPVRVVTATKP